MEEFDPTGHNVDDVVTYLRDATADERERVLSIEREGKARSGILGAQLDDEQPEPEQPEQEGDVKAATVRPQRYTSGQVADRTYVREYDARGVLGKPRAGNLSAGQRGVLLVQEGDTLTRHVAHQLNEQ